MISSNSIGLSESQTLLIQTTFKWSFVLYNINNHKSITVNFGSIILNFWSICKKLISYNSCKSNPLFRSCVHSQLCSRVHSWQNIITRTIWSCCICWIGWANHFHRGFDKSFRAPAGTEPVKCVGRHQDWKIEKRNATEVGGWCISSRIGLLDMRQQGTLTRQKDNFTCKGSPPWNKDHSILNFPFFGNFVSSQMSWAFVVSVHCFQFNLKRHVVVKYSVEKCKSMNELKQGFM